MVTPFKGKNMEEIDHQALRKLTNFLIENGVHGLIVHGTSGEFLMQDFEERTSVVETVVKTCDGKIPVIAGVSEGSTKNVIALGKAAIDAGADAILSTGPIYFKTDEEGLYNHFQGILDHVDLPLMIYNIPSWIGYEVPKETIRKLIEENPQRIAGVKFTSNDLDRFYEYLRALGKKTSMMIGSDSLIFSALELGAAGGILGSANVLPRETSEIYELVKRGEASEARRLQERVATFAEAMILGTFPSALKEGLKFIGMDCGDVRPPLQPLTTRQASEVARSLAWKKKKNDKTT